MTFIATGPYLDRAPVYFHRVSEGQTLEDIAAKYQVDVNRVLAENPGVKAQPGEVVVVSLRGSST